MTYFYFNNVLTVSQNCGIVAIAVLFFLSVSTAYADEVTLVLTIDDFTIDDLGRPYGVTTDSNDRIIVATSSERVIYVFDEDGDLKLEITNGTNKPSVWDKPHVVTTDSNDRIIVADLGTDVISVFDSTGVFDFEFTISITGFKNVSGVATDSNDRIIVTDSGNDAFYVFDSTGNEVFTFDNDDDAICIIIKYNNYSIL